MIGIAWVVVMDCGCWMQLWVVVISRITSLTRSSMRKRDSFQAKRERNMVLCGKEEMLSDSKARI